MKINNLFTPWGEDSDNLLWDEYPRPRMRRDNWINLNGMWSFEDNTGFSGEIRVPFCPESILSGVHKTYPEGAKLTYSRSFDMDAVSGNEIAVLHFGAADQIADVFINDTHVGHHEGGYIPFSFDITSALCEGKNVLRVEIIDDLSPKYPHGKQKNDRGGMWYTPVSGIWQTVWIEILPENHITGIRVDVTLNSADITVSGNNEGYVEYAGRKLFLHNGRVHISVAVPRNWTPENPVLYPFSVVCGEDRVQSYFALRTFGTGIVNGVNRLLLNGRPYFFNGVLDQGYFSDGLYTPASPEAFRQDILVMKSMGFNTLRKHIKIEPEIFYYECDRLGMVVFQDMVNSGEYDFKRDSLLPTLGFRKINDSEINADPDTREIFFESVRDTVNLLYSYPCIGMWTIFNEGWGQFRGNELYEILHSLDGSRIIDTASGWFKVDNTDIESRHIYFGRLRHIKSDKPVVLSEYGGYALKIKGHSFKSGLFAYGYKQYLKSDAYRSALSELFTGQLMPLVRNGLSAAIYTQLSDVEDETNGLLTYDRAVIKVDPDETAAMAKLLFEASYSV